MESFGEISRGESTFEEGLDPLNFILLASLKAA
jgi:hypothetical protein